MFDEAAGLRSRRLLLVHYFSRVRTRTELVPASRMQHTPLTIAASSVNAMQTFGVARMAVIVLSLGNAVSLASSLRVDDSRFPEPVVSREDAATRGEIAPGSLQEVDGQHVPEDGVPLANREIDQWRIDLLLKAFAVATAIPVNPHIKDRPRAQRWATAARAVWAR